MSDADLARVVRMLIDELADRVAEKVRAELAADRQASIALATVASRIPFVELALDAAEVGALLGQERRYVLERVAPLPGFPAPCSMPGQQKRWLAGDILEWREANLSARKPRRR